MLPLLVFSTMLSVHPLVALVSHSPLKTFNQHTRYSQFSANLSEPRMRVQKTGYSRLGDEHIFVWDLKLAHRFAQNGVWRTVLTVAVWPHCFEMVWPYWQPRAWFVWTLLCFLSNHRACILQTIQSQKDFFSVAKSQNLDCSTDPLLSRQFRATLLACVLIFAGGADCAAHGGQNGRDRRTGEIQAIILELA